MSISEKAGAITAGLEQLLAAIHADDPKRELLVRVGDLMREVSALPLHEDALDKIAPVQGYSAGIPWSMHLRAYDAYCKKHGPQQALIEGWCRGGFGTSELDNFIPGWREELSELHRLRTENANLRRECAALAAAPPAPMHAPDCALHNPLELWDPGSCTCGVAPPAPQAAPNGLENLKAILADQPYRNSAFSVIEIETILENGGGFMPDEAVSWFRSARGNLAAAPPAPAQEDRWQPIETAPKDDKFDRILLRFDPPFPDPTEPGIAVGCWTATGWYLTCIWASSCAHRKPTHWQPLRALIAEKDPSP